MKAVIYTRYSTDQQREESAEVQEMICREYADKKGYTVTRAYSDPARSGRNDKRPQFQQMMTDAKLGLFECIIIHKIDRIHRNLLNYFKYEKELNDNGVQLFCVTIPFELDPTGISKVVAVQLAEWFSKNLAEEVRKGQKINASKALTIGGVPPLGYDVNKATKEYAINETEAEIIKEVFAMKASGEGYGKIIETLNAKGYKTKRGDAFGKNSIHDILKNKKYIGVYSYGRVTADEKGKRNNHKNESTMMEIIDGIPAIIEKSVWDKVQSIMEADKRETGKYSAKVEYLLSGKIFCACGAAMTGHRKTKREKSGIVRHYYIYECNRRQRKNDCSGRNINKNVAEELVEDYLFNNILSAENAANLKLKLNQSMQERMDKNQEDRELYKNQLEDSKQAMDNLFSMIKKGFADDLMMAEYQKEKQRYDIALTNVSTTAAPALFTDDQIKSFISIAQQKEKSDDLLRIVFNIFIEKVVLLPDGSITVTSRYRLSDNNGGGHLVGGGSRDRTGDLLNAIWSCS